jgi:hypothetical protein
MVKSRRVGCAGNVARMKERNIYRIMVRKPEERRLLGTGGHRWVVNIKTDQRDKLG